MIPATDLYATFPIRLVLNDAPVAGATRVTGLYEPRTKFDAITLERGLTHDTTFAEWLHLAVGTHDERLRSRKELRIEVYDEQRHLVLAGTLHRSWPSAYSASPGIDPTVSAWLIESLTMQHEGWEQDPMVKMRPERKDRRHGP